MFWHLVGNLHFWCLVRLICGLYGGLHCVGLNKATIFNYFFIGLCFTGVVRDLGSPDSDHVLHLPLLGQASSHKDAIERP